MGRDRAALSPGLRSFPHEDYVIFYKPARGGIEVVRVLHGARDLNRFFQAAEGKALNLALSREGVEGARIRGGRVLDPDGLARLGQALFD